MRIYSMRLRFSAVPPIPYRVHQSIAMPPPVRLLIFASIALLSLTAQAEDAGAGAGQAKGLRELDAATQAIKADLLDLEADLTALELDLRYPPPRRWTVFVTMSPALADLELREVVLQVDGRVVASHSYPAEERAALAAGGAQRLHITNLRPGRHEIAVELRARYDGDPYHRQQRFVISKPKGPRLLELRLVAEAAFPADEAADEDPAPGFVGYHYDDRT